jgi:tetratricopeptide (TPR) repeat protein
VSTPADKATVALERASALYELRRFPEAAGLLRQAIASEPQNPAAWSLLAAAELSAGNHDSGLKAAERAIPLVPDAEWPQRLAAQALRLLGRTEESIRHAREAVRLDPDSWQSHTTLARSLAMDNSNLPEAREAAGRAIALAPNHAEAHITAGVVAAAAKDRSDAEASFRQALSIDPQNSVAHSELARMRMGGRHHTNPVGLADAATGFATSVQVDPRSGHGRRNLEVVLRVFLAKASYFIFIDAYLIARIGSSSSPPAARLLPILLLAIPAGYAQRFITRLSGDLRKYLLRLLTHDRKIGLAVSLDALAVACLIAAALVPQSVRNGLAGTAAVSALIGRLILWSQVEQSSRAARGLEHRHTLGTPVLWLLAVALGLIAIAMFFAGISSRTGLTGILVALLLAAGSALTVRSIKRRRSVVRS